MTNSDFQIYITNRIASAQEAIAYADEKLAKSPEGSLIIRVKNGKPKYYQKNIDNREKFLGKHEEKTITELQEKEYCQKLKKSAKQENTLLNKILTLLKKTPDSSSVFINLPENKRTKIASFVSVQEEAVKRKIESEYRFWKKYSYDKKGVSKDLNLVTIDGDRVRSKSELIIADRLKAAEIPYKYEGKYVFINEKTNDYETWFPDFQVLNKSTGDLFFWEHFGIMDNPEYCASCQYKLETYAKHGIVMGKNLIVTMESSQHNLNTEYIDNLINTFLK